MSTITKLKVDLYDATPVVPETDGDSEEAIIENPDTGIFTTKETSVTTTNQSSQAVYIGVFCAVILFTLITTLIFRKIKVKKSNKDNYYNLKRKTNRHYLKGTVFAFTAIFLGVGIFNSVFAAVFDQDKDVEASKELSIDAGILATNDIAYIHDTINVPATENGFKLYISADRTYLVDESNPKYKIESISSKGQLADNTYGIYVGKEAPTADSEFYPIYSASEQYNIFSTTSKEAQTIDVWYGVKSKSNKEAVYSNNLTINVIGAHDYTLQEMNEDICAQIEPGIFDAYEFKDTRDDKTYNVGKYADGNCWMLQNLDLALSTDMTLTSEDTDLEEGKTWTPSNDSYTDNTEWEYSGALPDASTWTEPEEWKQTYDDCLSVTAASGRFNGYEMGDISKCADYSYDGGDRENGNYYNAISATAGTIKYVTEEKEEDGKSYTEILTPASSSICPANWHMTTYDELVNLFSQYATITSSMNEGSYVMDNFSSNLLDSIKSFNKSGVYVGNVELVKDTVGAEQVGILTSIDEVADQISTFANAGIYFSKASEGMNALQVIADDFGIDLLEGYSVRCIADYSNYNLTFDSNISSDIAVSNIPKNQTLAKISGENSVTFKIPSEVPVRDDGVEFIGWATSKDDAKKGIAKYNPGDSVVSYGASIQLYAAWAEGLEKTPKAILTANSYLTFVYDYKPYIVGKSFVTRNGESSTISAVYGDIENQTPMHLNPTSMESLTNSTNFVDYLPEWSKSAYNASTNTVNYIQLEAIDFNESFKEFEPDTTHAWFAYIELNDKFYNLQNLNTSEVQSMDMMFMDTLIDSVQTDSDACDISNFDTSKVTTMNAMFMMSTCNINGVENFITNNLQSASAMFAIYIGNGKDSITVDFSNWNVSRVTDFSSMFVSLSGALLRIKGVEHWDTSNATNMADMFNGAYLDYSDWLNLTGWNVSKVTDMSGMFESVRYVTQVKLDGWNTSNVVNLSSMFSRGSENGIVQSSTIKKVSMMADNSATEDVTENGWALTSARSADQMFYAKTKYANAIITVYSDRDWSDYGLSGNQMFYNAGNIIGGYGTTYSSSHTGLAYAHPDSCNNPGYFTNPKATGTCDTTSTSGTSYTSTTGSSANTPEAESSTTEENTTENNTTENNDSSSKNNTNNNDTESEQTEPLGVKKSVEKNSTVDTAVIAVIVASFVLVSTGAIIIFLIEKRRNDDDDEE